MENRYAFQFLATVALDDRRLGGVQRLAGAYILKHPPAAACRPCRVSSAPLKPVWLEQIQPSLVFVGSSRVRDGFDPALIDPALTPAASIMAPPA